MENDLKKIRAVLNIALFGHGKMGEMVEACALQRGHSLVKDRDNPDLFIDFTVPDAVLGNVRKAVALKKNIVIGTTGWEAHFNEVRKIVENEGIGLLYSPNFSIGIHLFAQIVKEAAQLIDSFEEYDIGLIESHHKQKIDSPSGTAKMLLQTLNQNLQRKQTVQTTSFRCGSIPGTHTVIFDSPADTIQITHEARNREGFALGAVKAAEWLHGKKGLYQFEDIFL